MSLFQGRFVICTVVSHLISAYPNSMVMCFLCEVCVPVCHPSPLEYSPCDWLFCSSLSRSHVIRPFTYLFVPLVLSSRVSPTFPIFPPVKSEYRLSSPSTLSEYSIYVYVSWKNVKIKWIKMLFMAVLGGGRRYNLRVVQLPFEILCWFARQNWFVSIGCPRRSFPILSEKLTFEFLLLPPFWRWRSTLLAFRRYLKPRIFPLIAPRSSVPVDINRRSFSSKKTRQARNTLSV